jgi:very-short-patch-repair endonuclease
MANEIARNLRKRMTRQEVALWLRLRELRKLGFHFRRQVPIKDYVVDFACYHPKVVVELDGSQHARDYDQKRDGARDARLMVDGFEVVRVWNRDVDSNLEGVLDLILSALRQRNPPTPTAQ